MGGFNFIFCVAENFIKTVGFDFIVSNANDFIKNSESSTLSTKNIKTSFLYPTDNKGIGFFPVPFFCILQKEREAKLFARLLRGVFVVHRIAWGFF